MIWNNIFIRSVGTYLPERFPVEDISTTASSGKYTGYKSITKSDMPQHVMAGAAAMQAFQQSSQPNETISTIVYASAVADTDHLTPVCYVQRILAQPEALAFELNAASDGGVAGIEVVARILSGDPSMDVGLVCSTMRVPNEIDRWSAGALNGDGSAALILSKDAGFARVIVSQRICNPDFEVLHRKQEGRPGTFGLPDFDTSYGPYIGTIAQDVSATISRTLAAADITIRDVSHFCLPALPLSGMQAIYLDPNNIPIEKTSWPELCKNGHVGPCDQILGIANLLETGDLQKGQFILLVGGGLGLRLTCLLLQML